MSRLRQSLLLSASALAWLVPSASLALTTDNQETWQAIFAAGDLLRLAERGELPEWPPVDSPAAQVRTEISKEVGAERRRRAARLLLTARRELKDARGLDSSALAKRLLATLSLREHLLKQPSYGNHLLADALANMVGAEVARHVVESRAAAPEIVAAVERLRSTDVDIAGLVTAATRELGHDAVELENGTSAPEAFFQLVDLVDGMEYFQIFPPGMTAAELLTEGDFAGLLVRIWHTDFRLRIGLRLLVDFLADSEGERELTYERMDAKLLRAEEELRYYDTPLHRTTWGTVSEVFSFVRSVDQGRIDSIALLGDLDSVAGQPEALARETTKESGSGQGTQPAAGDPGQPRSQRREQGASP